MLCFGRSRNPSRLPSQEKLLYCAFTVHIFANPNRFLSIARPLTPWCGWIGALLSISAIVSGLFLTPPDYLQGDSVRIMYIHVPAAWLGMAGWSGIAIASLMQIVWRHPLASVAARAVAVPGALYTAICLISGSIWGRPTWGTWWEWDGRLTSMLILFFLYLAYIALSSAGAERGANDRISAIFGVVGAANIPVIHYSVQWWRTLHQGESISLSGTTIDGSILWPLPIALLGFSLLFAAIVLMRMRALLASARVEARLKRMAVE